VTLTVEKEGIHSFPDLSSSHRFYNEITYLLGREIITGFPDGTFKPDRQLIRSDF
jgi:hypothetical protein